MIWAANPVQWIVYWNVPWHYKLCNVHTNTSQAGYSRCPSLQHYFSFIELRDADLLFAAVLLPPHPDGLRPHGGDDGLVGTVLILLDVYGLSAAVPPLLVEQLPALDPRLPYHARGRGGRGLSSTLKHTNWIMESWSPFGFNIPPVVYFLHFSTILSISPVTLLLVLSCI